MCVSFLITGRMKCEQVNGLSVYMMWYAGKRKGACYECAGCKKKNKKRTPGEKMSEFIYRPPQEKNIQVHVCIVNHARRCALKRRINFFNGLFLRPGVV